MIRVLLAEDMRVLRDTLAALLNLEPDIDVVAQVASGQEIVPAVLANDPHVALLDIDLPGKDGITAAAELVVAAPQCRVLVLTGLGTPTNLRRAVAAHVAGFTLKDAPAEDLIRAVRDVAAGRTVFDPQLAVAALRASENPLSVREIEVLTLFADGSSAADIARQLYLSHGTVRNYLASVVTKLDARNRVDAARIARECGWLQP
jgi:two-component system, NarL family, response regulator DesR